MLSQEYKRVTRDVLQSNVIGRHGQTLGRIDEIVIDMKSGNIAFVMLTTRWSKVQLAWHSVMFDEREDAFRICRRSGAGSKRLKQLQESRCFYNQIND